MDIDSLNVVKSIDDLPDDQKKHFSKLPEELHGDAEKVLDGKPIVQATPKTSSGKRLVNWASSERKKRADRNRAKRARKARRKGRK